MRQCEHYQTLRSEEDSEQYLSNSIILQRRRFDGLFETEEIPS
jgi:hypothetical protein